MPVSFVDAVSGGVSTSYPAACQTGDIILALGVKTATTALSVPAAFTELGTINTDGMRSSLAWRLFTSGDTAPTWPTGVGVNYLVYRGANTTDPIGDFGSSSGTGTTVTFPARTLQNSSGSSWVAGMMGIENTDSTETTAPSGMTNRANITGANQSSATHDTNGGVTSWSSQTAAVGGTSTGWHGWTIEILSAAGAYTLTADAGAISIAGIAANVVKGRPLASAAGAVDISGTAANVVWGHPLVADAGAITVAGTAANVVAGRNAAADAGALSLTGTAATLAFGPKLTADAGTVAIAGTAATLGIGRVVTAASGAVTVTGTDASLVYDMADATLVADPGSVAISGTAATLQAARKLTADAGACTLAGTASGLLFTPDDYVAVGRTSFGTELTSAVTIQGGEWHALDDTMTIHYNPGWVRTTVAPGEVASGDPSTSERSEIDTLSLVQTPLGGSPIFCLSFDLWVPTTHYMPGGGSQLVMAQILVTSYGPPMQILWHPAGNIRVRNLVSGSFQHSIIVADDDTLRGKWTAFDIRGKITKNSDGWLTVDVDGVRQYSLTGAPTVEASASDVSSIYGKLGAYRTAVDTDTGRGMADLWYRNAAAAYEAVIDASAGAISITGTDATLRRDLRVVADAGAIALAGVAAELKTDRRVIADAAAYVITGSDVDLIWEAINAVLIAWPGEVIVTGTDAGLEISFSFILNSGQYAIGDDEQTTLFHFSASRAFTLNTGYFTIGDEDATLIHYHAGDYHFTLRPTTFTIGSGETETVLFKQALTNDPGSIALTGNSAVLTKGRKLSAASGFVVLTLPPTSIVRNRMLNASAGELTLTGTAATLGAQSYRVLPADPGAIALTGTATFYKAYVLDAASTSITVVGTDASIDASLHFPTTTGSMTITGTAAELVRARILVAANGGIALTGAGATFGGTHYMVAEAGTVFISLPATRLRYSLKGDDDGYTTTYRRRRRA